MDDNYHVFYKQNKINEATYHKLVFLDLIFIYFP